MNKHMQRLVHGTINLLVIVVCIALTLAVMFLPFTLAATTDNMNWLYGYIASFLIAGYAFGYEHF